MYLHVYFICTQGPKMLSEQCCLSLCLSIILYCSKRSKSKNQSSFTDRSGGLVAPTPTIIIIIIVQHFRDQFMIGLPCLFAH